MPTIDVHIEWDHPDDPFWLNADNVALTLHAYCKNTKFKVSDIELLPSEALFGFASWLTTRDEKVVASAKHDAGQMADLVKEFCKANNLPEPREGWAKRFVFPEKRKLNIDNA